MQYRIESSSGVPIYRQIVGQIRTAVARGQLLPGEKLPTVREMSRLLLINPNTVMRAYQILERGELITTRRGKGIYLTANAIALCQHACGHDDLDRLKELIARLQAQGISVAEIKIAVKQALAAPSSSGVGYIMTDAVVAADADIAALHAWVAQARGG